MSDGDDWGRRRKVASMPGVIVTPQMVLSRTLDKAQQNEIDRVVVLVRWKDGSSDVDWSQMRHSEFSHMALVLLHEAMFLGRDESVVGL